MVHSKYTYHSIHPGSLNTQESSNVTNKILHIQYSPITQFNEYMSDSVPTTHPIQGIQLGTFNMHVSPNLRNTPWYIQYLQITQYAESYQYLNIVSGAFSINNYFENVFLSYYL